MSTIRIYSKKTFAIGPGAIKDTDTIDSFMTVPGSFQDMPEIYKNDPTFKLAVKAHEIEVIDKPISIPTDVTSADFDTEDEIDDNVIDPIDEYKEKLKVMKKEEVKEEAEKYNAKFDENDSLKVNKKRVFEAFKLSMNNADPVSE